MGGCSRPKTKTGEVAYPSAMLRAGPNKSKPKRKVRPTIMGITLLGARAHRPLQ
jgi:hypothetical protein